MKTEEQEKIVKALTDKFAEEVLQVGMTHDFLTIIIKPEKIVAIVEYLYNHKDTQFQFLTTLFGIHLPDQNQIGIVYQLHNLVSNQRLRLKTFLPADNPVIQTITPIFSGANWKERETFDFFGVTFQGHPKLKRILNVDEMIMFPLRKEFPLEDQTREDKNDKLFGR